MINLDIGVAPDTRVLRQLKMSPEISTNNCIKRSINNVAANGDFDALDYLLEKSGKTISDVDLDTIIGYNSGGLSNGRDLAWQRVRGALDKGVPITVVAIRRAIRTGNVGLVQHLWSTLVDREWPQEVLSWIEEGFTEHYLEDAIISGNRDMVEWVYKRSRKNIQLHKAAITEATKCGAGTDYIKYVVDLYERTNNTTLEDELKE